MVRAGQKTRGRGMDDAQLTIRKLQTAAVGLGLMMLLCLATFAHGAAVSPFAGLSGAWAGPGNITLADGSKENIRCRANYGVDGGGMNLKVDLRCSSDSFKFELQGSASHSNGEVAGFWNEQTKRVGGTLTGKASGDTIEVRIEGPFAAILEISTRADRQAISIQSPGSKVSEVAMALNRANKVAMN